MISNAEVDNEKCSADLNSAHIMVIYIYKRITLLKTESSAG